MELSITSSTSNITFTAIKHFVADLVTVFGSGGGKSPLGLYNRLTVHVEGKDSIQGVEKYLSGFKAFFSDYSHKLGNNEELLSIPRDTIIKYGDSDKVYIEIQKFIYKSRNIPDQLETIRQHLLTIFATIKPDEDALLALEKAPKVEPSSIIPEDNESGFVKKQMDNIKQTLESENVDMSDPMNGIMVLMQRGVITGMIEKLQEGVESGTLNPEKMLAELEPTLSGLMKDAGGEGGVDMDQINALTSQAVFQNFMSSMIPPENSNIEEVDVD